MIENTEVDSEDKQSPEPENDAEIISQANEMFLEDQPAPEVFSTTQELLSNKKCTEEDTERQRSINKILRTLNESKVIVFTTVCKDSIFTAFHDHCTESCKTKNMTGSQKECLQIANQESYEEHIKTLFSVAIPSRPENIIANIIFALTRGSVLSEKISQSCPNENLKNLIISKTSHRKVHYLAGRCPFKIKK